VVVAVIALLTAACSDGTVSVDPPGQPIQASTLPGSATTRVQSRDIYETVRLEGIVETYAKVPVTAPEAGSFVPTRDLANGRTVKKGAVLGKIEKCLVPANPPAAVAAPGPSAPAGECGSLRRTSVTAPVDGALSGLSAQDLSVGATVATIQPPGLHIRLPIADPATLYRFTNPPTSGKAELVGGPAGFTVSYERRFYSPDDGRVSVYTSLPGTVPAFEGLHAVVVFVTSVKNHVPTLPLSAVRGRAGQGRVVTVDAAGKRTTVEVTIGDSDDAYVVITGLGTTVDVLLYPLDSDFSG
jgi:hypothetical protein